MEEHLFLIDPKSILDIYGSSNLPHQPVHSLKRLFRVLLELSLSKTVFLTPFSVACQVSGKMMLLPGGVEAKHP